MDRMERMGRIKRIKTGFLAVREGFGPDIHAHDASIRKTHPVHPPHPVKKIPFFDLDDPVAEYDRLSISTPARRRHRIREPQT
jgi:hypothetical protein